MIYDQGIQCKQLEPWGGNPLINQKPLVIAHRGAAGEAPEITLKAFAMGVEQGCDGIELDVHMTKEGEIVVIHDGIVDRPRRAPGKSAK